MIKHLTLILLFFTLSACGQKTTEMKTPENAKGKFVEFIANKKFLAENYYPGIADEKLRPIFSKKINQAALDFQNVAKSDKPTDKKYQKKILIGLSRFGDVYMELDTEDRERVCSYFIELMDIVGLESSDGHLNEFMYGFDPIKVIDNN
ncbi:MAG: DUF4844 domain-containing protein [Flavobacteriaceae bacterium]|nr:DUF4844 domain-containing protein [Flavobacteriaceae bacterium]